MILPFFKILEFLGSYILPVLLLQYQILSSETLQLSYSSLLVAFFSKLRVPPWNMCKTLENSNFLKNDKMVISVKIRNFSRSQMTQWTSPLESSCEI